VSYVEALLEERRGYLQRRLMHRVAEVDRELARFGFVVDEEQPETATERPPERVVKARGRPRRTP
jgi:hypothetical protein